MLIPCRSKVTFVFLALDPLQKQDLAHFLLFVRVRKDSKSYPHFTFQHVMVCDPLGMGKVSISLLLFQLVTVCDPLGMAKVSTSLLLFQLVCDPLGIAKVSTSLLLFQFVTVCDPLDSVQDLTSPLLRIM